MEMARGLHRDGTGCLASGFRPCKSCKQGKRRCSFNGERSSCERCTRLGLFCSGRTSLLPPISKTERERSRLKRIKSSRTTTMIAPSTLSQGLGYNALRCALVYNLVSTFKTYFGCFDPPDEDLEALKMAAPAFDGKIERIDEIDEFGVLIYLVCGAILTSHSGAVGGRNCLPTAQSFHHYISTGHDFPSIATRRLTGTYRQSILHYLGTRMLSKLEEVIESSQDVLQNLSSTWMAFRVIGQCRVDTREVLARWTQQFVLRLGERDHDCDPQLLKTAWSSLERIMARDPITLCSVFLQRGGEAGWMCNSMFQILPPRLRGAPPIALKLQHLPESPATPNLFSKSQSTPPRLYPGSARVDLRSSMISYHRWLLFLLLQSNHSPPLEKYLEITAHFNAIVNFYSQETHQVVKGSQVLEGSETGDKVLTNGASTYLSQLFKLRSGSIALGCAIVREMEIQGVDGRYFREDLYAAISSWVDHLRIMMLYARSVINGFDIGICVLETLGYVDRVELLEWSELHPDDRHGLIQVLNYFALFIPLASKMATLLSSGDAESSLTSANNRLADYLIARTLEDVQSQG